MKCKAKTLNSTYNSIEVALREKIIQHGILAVCIMEKVVHGNLDLLYLLQALTSLVMNMKITMTELQLKKRKGNAICREDYFSQKRKTESKPQQIQVKIV